MIILLIKMTIYFLKAPVYEKYSEYGLPNRKTRSRSSKMALRARLLTALQGPLKYPFAKYTQQK